MPLARPLVLVALLAPLAGAPAGAIPGVYLEEEVVTARGSAAPRVETARVWLVRGAMRREEPSRGSVTIVRDDRRALWVLDTRARTWYALDRDALERLAGSGLASVVPEGGEDPRDWLRKTGVRRRVGAWDAYEVRVEDRPLPGTRVTLWLSEDVPIAPELRAQLRSGGWAGASAAGRLLEGLRELPGYPVEVALSLSLGAQRLEVKQRLRKVEPREIGEERFELPAGFREVAAPLAAASPAPAAPPAADPSPSPPR